MSRAAVTVILCLVALASVASAAPAPPTDKPAPPTDKSRPTEAPQRCEPNPQFDRPDTERPRRPGPAPRDYLGLTAATLRERYGAPGCASPSKWRYWQPEGCAYERHVVTLWFARGKVSRVNVVHVWTGEECMSDQ
jgi:hypothetical protein